MTISDALLGSPWSDRASGQALARAMDGRPWFNRDRARVIHSAGFRRLQAKTQVLGFGASDFHRTRLTHSLEVAQIGQGIVLFLNAQVQSTASRPPMPPPDLIETIAFAHDLGHPPFGHGGERSLNACMREHGGFEGNAQSLRLIARLEEHTRGFGLDLCRRTLLGIVKYPVLHSRLLATSPTQSPLKCIYDSEADVLDWLMQPLEQHDRDLFVSAHTDSPSAPAKTFDATLMDVADDIAYGVHDLEDGITLGFIDQAVFKTIWQKWKSVIHGLPGAPHDSDFATLFSDAAARKRAFGALVHFFVVNVDITRRASFRHPLLACEATLRPEARGFLDALTQLVRTHVISNPEVQMLEFRGERIVSLLYEAFSSAPHRFLPAPPSVDAEPHTIYRGVCDAIASMTDDSATRTYEKLYGVAAR